MNLLFYIYIYIYTKTLDKARAIANRNILEFGLAGVKGEFSLQK